MPDLGAKSVPKSASAPMPWRPRRQNLHEARLREKKMKQATLAISFLISTAFTASVAAEISDGPQKADSILSVVNPNCEELATTLTGSKDEIFLWKQICNGKHVYLSDDKGNKKIIRGEFFEYLLTEPRFATMLSNKVIDISGAHFINDVHLNNMAVKSLYLSDNKFDKGASILNADGPLISIANNDFGPAFVLQLSNVRNFYFLNNTLEDTIIYNVSADLVRIEAKQKRFDAVDLRATSLFCCGDGQVINIIRAKLDSLELDGQQDENTTLDLSNSMINRIMNLTDGRNISTMKIDNLDFKVWSVAGEPQTLISKVNGSRIDLLQKMGEEYKKQGRQTIASYLLYERKNEEAKSATDWLDMVLNTVSWATVGYGFKLQQALYIIGALVLGGWIVFSTAARNAVTGEIPRSWFWFSIDSVIPGINLDDVHRRIAFQDWRQYYLYCLRVAGIVVVFLFVKYVLEALT
jgi:hypothetical protein